MTMGDASVVLPPRTRFLSTQLDKNRFLSSARLSFRIARTRWERAGWVWRSRWLAGREPGVAVWCSSMGRRGGAAKVHPAHGPTGHTSGGTRQGCRDRPGGGSGTRSAAQGVAWTGHRRVAGPWRAGWTARADPWRHALPQLHRLPCIRRRPWLQVRKVHQVQQEGIKRRMDLWVTSDTSRDLDACHDGAGEFTMRPTFP